MTDLVIRPAANKTDYLAGRELSSRVFSFGDESAYQRRMAESDKYLAGPGFDYGWYRIGMVDDQIVAHASAWPYVLRYGTVELPFGGLGAVCTHPDYRGQGYASAVIDDAIKFMSERGDLLSFLITDSDGFYTPLGYHNAWPKYTLEFPATAAADLDAPLTSRPAVFDDWPQMAQLYDRQWQHRVALVRKPDLWGWRMKSFMPRHTRVVERNGQIVGYIASHDSTGQWAEVVVETSDEARTLLAETGRLRQAAGHDSVQWPLAPDDPLLAYARRWLNCKLVTDYAPRMGWMGRIINCAGLRDALLPEMLAQSRLGERGLIFDIQADRVYLGLRGQDETNVQLDHSQFLPMMLGTMPPTALNLQPDAAQLLETLFPPRVAMLAGWDWF